ncbi:MAG TPA: glycogen synthase GlgA [Gammaproteobacteria bacterium]|nr:glycogen synthase GlgA [Gammaproteobacteria bacterium]
MLQKVLFASSEVYPLIKTGGLADVAGSLPAALCSSEYDVRLVLPAYQSVMDEISKMRCMARLSMPQGEVRIMLADLPGSSVKIWLVNYPPFFDRPGNPYLGPDSLPWHDNADRFALFCKVIVEIAMKRTRLKWKPDIIHCNDWQTGLVPALLSLEEGAPPSIFTVHNMAYQGQFPYSTFVALGLPELFWSYNALEFHEQLSFIKGGLVYADKITTVSPGYAREIQTEEFGGGLEGLLQHRSGDVHGILNGINIDEWNPETDRYIKQNYSIRTIEKKKINKKALQKIVGLPQKPAIPLIGFIGRLVEQKGIDIILQAMHEIMKESVQMVFLGTGDPEFQQALKKFVTQYPDSIAANIGYDEQLAHQIEAGVDLFLMPSRFEPCGLNQLYSFRYGTLPLVRKVGGLADTVINAGSANILTGKANGFVFDGDEDWDLLQALKRAINMYQDKLTWKKLQLTGMWRDSSWDSSALEYQALYQQVLADS